MNNHNTPTREAIVQVNDSAHRVWVTVMDIDPLDLPVTVDGLADAFHPGLVGLMDAVCAWESVTPSLEHRLVWSDNHQLVKAVCPVCDDVFPVSEGLPGDTLNEGYEAMCCGCEPRDQD